MTQESRDRDIVNALDNLTKARPGFWSRTACGVTRSLTPIPALLDRNAYAADTSRIRVLLVGGLSGRPADVDMALHALELYAGGGDGLALRIALSAVPCGNPDGLRLERGPENGAGGNPGQGYPPEGNFYSDEQNPEKRYLWRWICLQAPDLVIAVRSGDSSVRWEHNAAARRFAPALAARELHEDTLLGALGDGYPEGLGVIPALRLTCSSEHLAPRDQPPLRRSAATGNVRQVWGPPGPRPSPAALYGGRSPASSPPPTDIHSIQSYTPRECPSAAVFGLLTSTRMATIRHQVSLTCSHLSSKQVWPMAWPRLLWRR